MKMLGLVKQGSFAKYSRTHASSQVDKAHFVWVNHKAGDAFPLQWKYRSLRQCMCWGEQKRNRTSISRAHRNKAEVARLAWAPEQ